MPHALLMEPRPEWAEERLGGCRLCWAGRESTVRRLLALLPGLDQGAAPPDLDGLAPDLARLPGHFAVLIQGPDWVLAVADKVCGYPVFYVHGGKGFSASNSARALAREYGLDRGNDAARLEFRMAGYVTGADTLLHGLSKVRPGEALLWRRGAPEGEPQRSRYYRFHDPHVTTASEDDLIDELDALTNKVINRHIEDAGDRPIVVPLSGGLDSRVVAAKLKQRGAENVWTFSYGAPGNQDARVARQVAETLGLPWRLLDTTRDRARQYFHSPGRREYWDYADGLHIVPNLHAMHALLRLRDEGAFDKGAVVINGQSGDFIAGAHIPELRDGAVDARTLRARIMAKHYGNRPDLSAEPANVEAVGRRIEALLDGMPAPESLQEYAKVHELWEWQGRQSVRVVHGQRNYDYLGLDWELPMWEREWLEFWAKVPVEHKMRRRLFRRWCEREDFYGLFREFKPRLSRWPAGMGWVQVVGRGLKALLGERVSTAWYRRMEYFSSYSYLYAHLTYGQYMRRHEGRSAISCFAAVWEDENAALFAGGWS